MKYTLLGNNIELFFNDPMQGEKCVDSNFDYSTPIFITTHGITDILIYKDEEELRVFQQIIFNDIILKIKTEAKSKSLDFMQIMIINGVKCVLIDNGNDICLMGTEEYEE